MYRFTIVFHRDGQIFFVYSNNIILVIAKRISLDTIGTAGFNPAFGFQDSDGRVADFNTVQQEV